MADPITAQDVSLYSENDLPISSVVTADGLRRVAVEIPPITASGENKWQKACSDGKGFSVTTNHVLIASTGDLPFLLIKNTNGSGKNIRIRNVYSAIEENENEFFVYIHSNPTITANGTVLTIAKMLTSGGASIATAFRAPTVSNLGTIVAFFGGKGGGKGGGAVTPFDLGLIVRPNENLLLSIDLGQSNRDAGLAIDWIEE